MCPPLFLFPEAAPKSTFCLIPREKGNDCIGSCWVSAPFDSFPAFTRHILGQSAGGREEEQGDKLESQVYGRREWAAWKQQIAFLALQDHSSWQKGDGCFLSCPDWLLILHLVVLPRHCAVLLTGEGDKFAEAYEAFLTFAAANTKDTLKFVHIYRDRQPEFADAFLMDEEKYRGKSAVRVSFFSPPPSSFSSVILPRVTGCCNSI